MNNLALWHEIVEQQDPGRLGEVLAPDCVFLSPIVHAPQEGRELTTLYLTGAMQVLSEGFRYIKEVQSGNHAVLEFVCELDGLQVNGVDIITFNEEGRIIEFKVMVRPLKAINAVHGRMQAMLEQLSA